MDNIIIKVDNKKILPLFIVLMIFSLLFLLGIIISLLYNLFFNYTFYIIDAIIHRIYLAKTSLYWFY